MIWSYSRSGKFSVRVFFFLFFWYERNLRKDIDIGSVEKKSVFRE